MNQEYFISVVIPTYNRAKLLVPTINSVLSQTYRQFEIVVIDDGSTDGTTDAIQTIIQQESEAAGQFPRIRYFYQDNKGQSVARNRGIAEAAGDWIAFLDSDDLWLPEKLELQVKALQQFHESCGACFTDARLVDSQGLEITAFEQAGRHYTELMGVEPDQALPLAKAFGGSWVQTLVARTDFVRQAGGFDPDLHFGEDHDFLFRLALVAGHCYVNKVLAVIDRTNAVIDPTVASRTWDKIDFRLRGRQYMYEKWLNAKVDYPDDVRKAILGGLRGVHSAWTNWYLEQNQFDKARRAMTTALKYETTPRLAFKWALTWFAPRIAQRIVPKTSAML